VSYPSPPRQTLTLGEGWQVLESHSPQEEAQQRVRAVLFWEAATEGQCSQSDYAKYIVLFHSGPA
jgi:hypothetical protein